MTRDSWVAGEGEAACGSFTEVLREMYTSAVTDVAFLHGSTAAVARREHNYLSLFCAQALQVQSQCGHGQPQQDTHPVAGIWW